MPFLPPNQQRQSTEGTKILTTWLENVTILKEWDIECQAVSLSPYKWILSIDIKISPPVKPLQHLCTMLKGLLKPNI